jgi:hypothetical protein
VKTPILHARRIAATIGALVAVLILWAGPAHADGSRPVSVYNDTSGALVTGTLEWETIGGGYYTIRAYGTVYDLAADGWAAIAQLKYYTPSGWKYPIIGKAASSGDSEVFFHQTDGATYLYIRACLYKADLGPTDCSDWV